jgi:hypothetical protein
MSPATQAALKAARTIWARASGNADDHANISDTAVDLWTQQRIGLQRWVGVAGYQALFERTLGLTREDYPWLGSTSAFDDDRTQLAMAVRSLGAAEVTNGMVAMLATLIKLLGRIIGDEMAIRLVEQVGTPSPRGAVSNNQERTRDAE